MDRPNLSVVHTAAATAVQVGSTKEPPQRRAPKLDTAFQSVTRERAFNYDWKERLQAIRPSSHPMMPFTQYRENEERLYAAVRILNATSLVEFPRPAELVVEALDRLRYARHDDNQFKRITHQGLTDYQMEGEDLTALMKLAAVAGEGTSLRAHLEAKWVRDTVNRDNARDGWQLRTDLANELEKTIPGSQEEKLYLEASNKLKEADRRALHAGKNVVRLFK